MERANMLALAEYEDDLCHCGLPTDVADADPDLKIRWRDCPVCSGLAKAMRAQGASDAALARQIYGQNGPQPGDELPQDGRHFAGFEPADDD